MNERRAAVLNKLRARGLNVVDLFDVYGVDRDAAIARAKVVANIHFYETATFEAVRVSHLLANGVCVVSEGRADDPDAADLADGLTFCLLDAFTETCVALVADDGRRRSMEVRARTTATSCSQAQVLRAAFDR